jgi:dihydrofolate synthase / folylpolyglutamate synthase
LEVLQPAPLVITVAGTNGKGSCIAMLENLLDDHQGVLGCYTSPHLTNFNERISVAGKMVRDEEICAAFNAIERKLEDASLTYFEYATLAAFWIFKQRKVDIALLEVGLGGRLDAVNIVDADVAIITSVDLDHQEWLGEDRNSIGVEKAGIARPGRPLVCGDPEPPTAMMAHLERLGSNIRVLGSEQFNYRVQGEQFYFSCADLAGQSVCFNGLGIPVLSTASALCAVQALVCLGLTPTLQTVRRAFAEATLPGRFQRIQYRARDFILDVAHNPAAARRLAEQLISVTRASVYGLIGVLGDKDIAGMIIPLLPVIDHWHVCDLKNVPRAASASRVAAILRENGVSAGLHDDVSHGILGIIGQMDKGDILVVFGSFYTVSGALRLLHENGVWAG